MPDWLQWIASAVGGAFVALVAFRTRIYSVERTARENRERIESGKQALVDAEKRLEERFDEAERRLEEGLKEIGRRQAMTLQIVADIANKVGVEKRFSDVLVRFLADDRGRVD